MASLIETPRSFRARSEFYHQLGALQQAGIGVAQSLQQTAPPNQRDRQHVREIIDRLNAGETFSESLESRESWLPTFDRMMIQAGETGGRLDDTFRILSDHYAQRSALIRDVLMRLAYPVFILHFIILMPGLISYGASLLGGGDVGFVGAFLSSLLTLGALYAAVFLLLYLGQANRGFTLRYWLEKLWHRVPMFGPALKELKLSRLSFALYALLNAGVNIREAWENAANASGSPWLATSVRAWLPELDRGLLPSEALKLRNDLPTTFRDLYASGEVSGQLDDSLERLAKLYHEEGTRHLKSAAGVATGLVYGAVVIAVAFIVIRFWMNYYNSALNAF
ncbi:MAG: type II secretion system F family protein [Verrucomicrobiota bacterium]|jgi:type II secretory pathway component PulF|nr:type II secretion system F family protein [Verrucomicrobiota bacterium]